MNADQIFVLYTEKIKCNLSVRILEERGKAYLVEFDASEIKGEAANGPMQVWLPKFHMVFRGRTVQVLNWVLDANSQFRALAENSRCTVSF